MAAEDKLVELEMRLAEQQQQISSLEDWGKRAAALRNILLLGGLVVGAVGTALVFLMTQWGCLDDNT